MSHTAPTKPPAPPSSPPASDPAPVSAENALGTGMPLEAVCAMVLRGVAS